MANPRSSNGKNDSHFTDTDTAHMIKVLQVSTVDLYEAVEYLVIPTPIALKHAIDKTMSTE